MLVPPHKVITPLTRARPPVSDYMYGRGNGNGRAVIRMYHAQFPDRRMPDHQIFQWFHRQHREAHSFHATIHDAGQRRAVPCPSLEERCG
ncbi:hypothetical protein TNCV_98171 [Trichonephila clavipes]|nr:hypothetical protein TNCV_98171 [Trichonephila clavipes]